MPRKRGRPRKPEEQRVARLNLTVSPQTLQDLNYLQERYKEPGISRAIAIALRMERAVEEQLESGKKQVFRNTDGVETVIVRLLG